VKAAIDAGVEAAQAVGDVLSAHVIARPSEGVAAVLPKATAAAARKPAAAK
jgi:ethanolamine utilization protein EutM